MNRRTRKVVNRAAVASRNAATDSAPQPELSGSAMPPPAHASGRPPGAIPAMAPKLACLFYRLIKHGRYYNGAEYYEITYRDQQIRSLAKLAQKLGLQLVIPKTA